MSLVKFTISIIIAGLLSVSPLVADDVHPTDNWTDFASYNTATNGQMIPVLAPIGSQSVMEGDPLTFPVSATDADLDSLILTAENVPTNATFTDNYDGTGTFNFNPGFTQAGIYDVLFIASDGTDADSESVQITVTEAGNQTPVLATIGSQSVEERRLLTFLVSAVDADLDFLILTAEDVPTNATFTDNSDGTGTFNFKPDFTQAGIYDVLFIASDGADIDSETVQITVEPDYVHPTDSWTDFASENTTINGVLMPVGAVIEAFDGDTVLCGRQFAGDVPGKYIVLHVYGDDPFSPDFDEGCSHGETISFTINGVVANKLGPGLDIWTGGGPIRVMDLETSQQFGLDITGDSEGGGESGSVVTITVSVQNTGDGIDLIDIGAGSQSGWDVNADFAVNDMGQSLPPGQTYIDPGETVIVTVEVSIPPGTAVGVEDIVTVTASSQFDPAISEEFPATITVEEGGAIYGFTVAGSQFGHAEAGEQVQYDLIVTNVGDAPDSVAFSWESSGSWAVTGPTPTNQTINPGAFIIADFFVDIPADAVAGDEDTLTVVAYSQTAPQKSDTIKIVTLVDETLDVEDEDYVIPGEFRLLQNYPNPFNPATVISFTIERPAEVTLEIYNILGQKVRTLVDEYLPAGDYEARWDSDDQAGAVLSSGIYFYRLSTNKLSLTRKMTLLK